MDQLIRAWLPKVNGLMLEEIEAINAELPFKAEPPALLWVEVDHFCEQNGIHRCGDGCS